MGGSDEQADQDRGIHYSNGGISWGTVHYPDRNLMAKIRREWTPDCNCDDGMLEVDNMPVPCRRCHPDGPAFWARYTRKEG